MRHVIDHVGKGARAAGHFESHVESLVHPEPLLHVVNALARHVHGHVRAHLFRKAEPVVVHIRHHDEARACMLHHRRRHAADRPRAGDQHILAEDIERERRVHRISERIENRRHVVIHARLVVPDIRHRHADVFRERPRAVHTDALRVRAKMPPPREAVPATPAHDMPLRAHDVALAEIIHVRSDVHDLADELMPHDHRHRDRLLRPRVPFENVQVRPADARLEDADEHVVDSDDRLGNVLQPEARF